MQKAGEALSSKAIWAGVLIVHVSRRMRHAICARRSRVNTLCRSYTVILQAPSYRNLFDTLIILLNIL